MSRITDALVRRNTQDIIHIGETAQRLYGGQHGELLRAIISGHIQQEAKNNVYDENISDAKVLGRIQAYQQIIDDIELMITQKDKLLHEPIEEESEY